MDWADLEDDVMETQPTPVAPKKEVPTAVRAWSEDGSAAAVLLKGVEAPTPERRVVEEVDEVEETSKPDSESKRTPVDKSAWGKGTSRAVSTERGGDVEEKSESRVREDRTFASLVGGSSASLSVSVPLEGEGKRSSTVSPTSPALEPLTEERILKRQRQIDIGKETIGYRNYRAAVPVENRVARRKDHPRTPEKTRPSSKRGWEGLVRQWRRRLHLWDNRTEDDGPRNEDGSPVTKSPRSRRSRSSRSSEAPKTKERPASAETKSVRRQLSFDDAV